MKAFVVRGYGIECEEEMRRAAKAVGCFESVEDLVLPKHFHSQADWPFSEGDWVLLPGGFSYADHFGSGKLLALKLEEYGFFKTVFARGAHMLGVCNGFQILTESGVWGESFCLQHNEPRGFINRWIQLESSLDPQNKLLRLPVRHGEGRFTFEGELSTNAKVFLKYDDSFFDNGSHEQIAGLMIQQGASQVWGMMPHPEIALWQHDDPNFFVTDFMAQHYQSQSQIEGDGAKLLKQIFTGTLNL